MILDKKRVFWGMIYLIQFSSGYRVDWTISNGYSIKRFFKNQDEAVLFYEHKYLELMQFGNWTNGAWYAT